MNIELTANDSEFPVLYFCLEVHLLLFITRKYTFIYAKSYINNVNKFFINSRIHFISVDRISIRIFEYVSIFNNVNWQTNARSDILSGNFIVYYGNRDNRPQNTRASLDKFFFVSFS